MRFSFLLAILLFINNLAAEAQQCFEAYNAQSKESQVFFVGEKITFEDCSNPAAEKDKLYYDFDKRDGITSNTANFYTYTKPGTYTVTQTANLGGASGTTTIEKQIEIKNTSAPSFTGQSCANRVVNFTITDANYDSYTLDFGDKSTPRTGLKSGQKITYTYAANGDYTAKLTGNTTGGVGGGTSELKVAARKGFDAPSFTSLRVVKQHPTSGKLEFTIKTIVPSLSYVIEQSKDNGATYTAVGTIDNVTTATTATYPLENVNTTQKYKYRLRSKDACGTTGNDVSRAIANVVLESSFSPNGVRLSWDIDYTSIRRIKVDINGITNPNIDKTDTEFTDADLTCGNTYEYVLHVDYVSGATSTSVLISETIPNVPAPKPGHLFSTFNEFNQVELTFDPVGQRVSQVNFERSMNGGAFEDLTSSTALTNIDDLDPLAPACYRASAKNFCDNESGYSELTCPVILTATPSSGTEIDFAWNKFSDYKVDGRETYEFQLLDAAKQIIETRPVTGMTSLSEKPRRPEEQIMYRIKVTLSDGSISYSNIAALEQNLLLFVPTAFTPNNDGLNDVLEVKGQQFFNLKLTIYNRSGNVVFQSEGETTGWDGTFKGKNAPVGVYSYTATFTTASGVPKRQTGTITLLR